MKFACYCRVSIERTEASQRKAIHAWLLNEGVKSGSVIWYVDNPGSELPELARLITDVENEVVQTVVICSIDRLATSFQAAAAVFTDLCQSGARVVIISPSIYVTPRIGPSVATIVRAVAQTETDLHRERQTAGILAAKERGVFKGRKKGATKAGVDPQMAAELRAKGLSNKAIAEQMGISKPTVMRYLGQASQSKQ